VYALKKLKGFYTSSYKQLNIKMVCSRCRQVGHNSRNRNCPARTTENANTNANTNANANATYIRCTRCNQLGHNSRNRNCPANARPVNATPIPTRSTPTPSTPASPCRRCNGIRTCICAMVANASNLYNFTIGINTRTEELIREQGQIMNRDGLITNLINDGDINAAEFFERCKVFFDTTRTYLDNLQTTFRTQHDIYLRTLRVYRRNTNIRGLTLTVNTRGEHIHQPSTQTNTIPRPTRRRNRPIRPTTTQINKYNYIKLLCKNQNEPLPENNDCIICYETCQKNNAIYTNCKHSYCLSCITTYMENKRSSFNKPNCPMCRTQITEFNTYDTDSFQTLGNSIYMHT